MEKPDTARPPAAARRTDETGKSATAPAPTARHEVGAKPSGPPEAVTPYDDIWFQRRPLS